MADDLLLPPGTGRTWSTTDGEVSPVTSVTTTPPAPLPQQELFRRQAISNAQLWNQLRKKTANMPLAQTEAAVAAALRFQGQRQYTKDLESGMSPGEALARSAPLIFSQPKQGNIGQAGTFIKNVRPPAARTMDVGGVLYRVNPDGTATAITPTKTPAAPKVSPLDTTEFKSIMSEMAATRKQLDALDLDDPKANDLRGKLGILNSQLQTIRKRTAAPTGGTASTVRRVKVTGPGGKRGTVPEGTKLPEGWSFVQ